MFLLAFMCTLFLGVAEGIMICIAVSLLIIVKKGSIPYWSLQHYNYETNIYL